jgi:uncharacterized protein (DUF433 family)
MVGALGGIVKHVSVDGVSPRALLGVGVYTVSEMCHILRPSITPRKVHYWLDKGMLGKAIRRGTRGTPTLLSFEQLLRIRTLQRLRDELRFSLRTSREALEWLLTTLVSDEWPDVHFFRAGDHEVGIAEANGETPFVIQTQQYVLPALVPGLDEFLQRSRKQWEQGFLEIEGYSRLISDPTVLAGSPVIESTRIETAFIANLATEESMGELKQLFPDVEEEALRQAIDFEGVQLAA